jgi:hypothetical protein
MHLRRLSRVQQEKKILSSHTTTSSPSQQVTWGQFSVDFKINADIAKADRNKAKSDNNNVADKAVVSNVAIKANEANEADNFDEADVIKNKANRAAKDVEANETN